MHLQIITTPITYSPMARIIQPNDIPTIAPYDRDWKFDEACHDGAYSPF